VFALNNNNDEAVREGETQKWHMAMLFVARAQFRSGASKERELWLFHLNAISAQQTHSRKPITLSLDNFMVGVVWRERARASEKLR
jgi:hypothetical protein